MKRQRHFLAIILITAIFVSPLRSTAAESASADVATLQGYIAALEAYIERTFLVGTRPALTHDELRTSIENAASWFTNAQESNGHFRYEYVPYEDRYRSDDNIVRQAGALYALGEIVRRDPEKRFALEEEIERAIGYFETLSYKDETNRHDFRCIVRHATNHSCALGATALALTGILGYLETYPDAQHSHQSLIDDYLSFILAMQKENGGFQDTYRIGSSKQNTEESSFSNGEALLALARYYSFERDDEVKRAVDTAFSYLKERPFDTPLYLWMMAALKDMHALWHDPEYLAYAERYTDWRTGLALSSRGTDRNYCAYTEGLASAYGLLMPSLADSKRVVLRDELDFWNRKNHVFQMTDSDTYRVVFTDGAASFVSLDDTEHALGGFLTAESELTQRIDFTQHCIGAFIQTLVDIDGGTL